MTAEMNSCVLGSFGLPRTSAGVPGAVQPLFGGGTYNKLLQEWGLGARGGAAPTVNTKPVP